MDNYIFFLSKYEGQTLDRDNVNRVNRNLRNELQKLKNNIENNHLWDTAKRNMNEYEFIFSSSKKHTKICKKNPISRAYFKLWEILKDFTPQLFAGTGTSVGSGITTAHIAEGPGGFIECLIDFKNKYAIDVKAMYGITLLIQSETDNKVPFWKLNKDICQSNHIYINRKMENIGDLYDVRNIDNFIAKVGKHKCKLVTADGGFDFSVDFNNQENSFLRLFLSEIYTAVSAQAPGGSFIIKIFDIFTYETNCLIAILIEMYEEIFITKPFTSRPANSEKYLVCTNFKGMNKHGMFQDLRSELINNGGIEKSLGKYYSDCVATRLCMYNTYYTNRQMKYLQKTLQEAEQLRNTDGECQINKNNEDINNCIEWCKKYDVDY